MAKRSRAQLEAQQDRLLERLRAFGANYNEFTRRFAASLNLHATDASALVEILYAEDQGAPLSPASLSEKIALSRAATTAVLNRLEGAGHVVRTREHADRRVVTVRSSPHIHRPATAFFTPLSESLNAMLERYPPELLRQVERFLDDLRATTDAVLGRPGAGR